MSSETRLGYGASQEEELLWQLCSPETLEDANFHGPMLGKACTPSSPSQRCVYAHQFSHLLWGMIREGSWGREQCLLYHSSVAKGPFLVAFERQLPLFLSF